jgi:hypothetical protein
MATLGLRLPVVPVFTCLHPLAVPGELCAANRQTDAHHWADTVGRRQIGNGRYGTSSSPSVSPLNDKTSALAVAAMTIRDGSYS